MAVNFFFHNTSNLLKARKRLKLFIIKLFELEKKQLGSLTYVFCSDEYLLNINKEFLQHNFYTDIITFNLSSATLIDGEIYISAERIKENSKHWKVSIEEELHRVIFHGALHLCGYNDKTVADKATMKEMENKYLKLYLT